MCHLSCRVSCGLGNIAHWLLYLIVFPSPLFQRCDSKATPNNTLNIMLCLRASWKPNLGPSRPEWLAKEAGKKGCRRWIPHSLPGCPWRPNCRWWRTEYLVQGEYPVVKMDTRHELEWYIGRMECIEWYNIPEAVKTMGESNHEDNKFQGLSYVWVTF